MGKLSIKGILIAFVVMLVIDLLAGLALLAIAMGSEGSSLQALPSAEQQAAIEAILQTSAYLVASLVVGLMTTAIGGYLAARIAKHDFHLNAAVFGVVGVVFGLLFAGSFPVWFNVAAFVLNVPAALLGGNVAKGKALAA